MGGVDQEESAPWSADPTPRTAAGVARAPVLPTDPPPMVPGGGGGGGVKPTIAQDKMRNSSWKLGLAHREGGVAREMEDIGWMPGFAHRERGVGVQRGFVSFKLDSHHLSSSGSPSWAPGIRFSNSVFEILMDKSTPGIALLLLPGIGVGQFACFSGMARSDDLRDAFLLCLLRFALIISVFVCFGVRGLADNLTAYCGRYSAIDVVAPSPAHIGKWIGRPRIGLGHSFASGLSNLPVGPPGAPAGETMVNFICWTFVTGLKSWISEGLKTPNAGPRVTNSVFMLKKVSPACRFDIDNLGLSVFQF